MDCCFCGHLCHKALCLNKEVILKRIRGQVRIASSLRTMEMASCLTVEKSAKLGSYDRVLRKLKKKC